VKLKPPTNEELEAFKPVIADRYKDMLERMRTVALAVLQEYPRTERVLACNALLGIASGALSVGLGLTEEEAGAFDDELHAAIIKVSLRAVARAPERFDGLPEPMKRPEGS
jgi:hypothetical protein